MEDPSILWIESPIILFSLIFFESLHLSALPSAVLIAPTWPEIKSKLEGLLDTFEIGELNEGQL
ncbi:Hypothetical protein BN69_1464 [Methylocystis sp. SC2]|nr:Hypothetical protein BN69_1464 [Methylocystis sp. SC2]